MAQTQAQWFAKLKAWVPEWYFESADYQEAHFQALALLLSYAEGYTEQQINNATISDSEPEFLSLIADERSKERLVNELTTTFRRRVRNLANLSNRVAIKRIVDSFLINGESQIAEDFDSGAFLGSGIYLSRGNLLLDRIKNVFTVAVENQTHEPFFFLGREQFMSREEEIGTDSAPIELFSSIIKAVEDAKAFGTLFRLVERA